MTQFALCIPGKQEKCSPVEYLPISADAWLSRIARQLFHRVEDVRIPKARTGESMHELFTEAHNSLLKGDAFGRTRLSGFLPDLVRECRAIVFWWGDDWVTYQAYSPKRLWSWRSKGS